MKLARAHGQTLAEYLEATTSRDLAEQEALVRVDGPQGQDRMDWCFAWLASWWLSDRSEKTVRALYANLIRTLRSHADSDEIEIIDDDREPSQQREIEIIDDDPELSRQREAELVAKVLKAFPRGPKKE